MRNLRMLSPLLRRLMPGLDVKDVLAELAERITEECDYELEAANHRRLARFWRRPPVRPRARPSTPRSAAAACWSPSGSTGSASSEVAEQPEPVRDRFAEIVYRFFYATAAELEVALGDPHPGNYLLCADDRVAFFDFGMLRELPGDYLRREGEVLARDPRERRAGAGRARCASSATCPGSSAEWDGALLLEHMRAAGWWFVGDEPLRLAPEDLWRGTESLREESGDQMPASRCAG